MNVLEEVISRYRRCSVLLMLTALLIRRRKRLRYI